MRIPEPLHNWDVTPKEAREIQTRLRPRIEQKAALHDYRFVAGADLSISPGGRSRGKAFYVACIVLWDRESRSIVETQTTNGELSFPYVPGLLSFREVPAILSTLKNLRATPNAIMCDGQGFAHPRRFGLACHLGVLLDMPTIGCAKSRLCGTHGPVDESRGEQVPLMDKQETIGAVVRTRDKVKPLYVSVGHRMDLQTAVKIVLACTAGFRLPEPTRHAHKLAGDAMGQSKKR